MNKIKIIYISLIFCLTFLPSNSYAILDLFEDENIYYVKNGTFYFDQSITVGQALEGNQYLTNPSWRSFNDSQGRKYVEFTADVKLDMLYTYAKKNLSFERSFQNVSEFNMPLEIIVHFVINLDDTFEFKDLMFRSPINEFTYSESLFDFEIPIMDIYENELPNFFILDYIKSGKNVLINAIKFKDLELVKKILEFDVNLNYKDNNYELPLIEAVISGNIEIVNLIIANGADVNIKNQYNQTALEIAIQKNDLKSAKLLIDNGAEVESLSPELFENALINNNLESVKFLIDHGANINYFHSDFYPALFIAIENNNLKMVKLLIDHGVNIHHFPRRSGSPLFIAIHRNHIEIAKLLIKNGANVHSVLDDAKIIGTSKDVIRILLDAERSRNLNDQANKNTQESKHDKEENIQEFTQGLVAPESKKAGTALIMPYDKDNMSLTSFTSDHVNDSLIRVLIRNQSPLIAVRVENMKGKIGSWKTKDVKTSAMGILKIENKGAVINHNNISFKLNISNPLELDLIMQDNGAITDPNTDLRVVFFFEDGNRAYSLVKR